jgi:hypothetical protein
MAALFVLRNLTKKTSPINRYAPCLLWAIVISFLIKCSLGNGDFKVFLEASKLVMNGKNPYHLWIFISEGNYAFFFNSPLWATLLIPFSLLPNFVANFLWLLLNLWFLTRIWRLLAGYTNLEYTLTKKQRNLLLALVILLNIRYIIYNFEMIQLTIFLLWGSLESLNLISNRREIGGGALLALIINIKLLPIVLIPYLIYRKKMKGLLFTLAFSLIFLLIPAVVIGWKTNATLLTAWWSVINPFNLEHLTEVDLGLHGLTALIPPLLSETQGALPYARNICNLDLETTTLILNGIRFGLILLSLYFLGWPPFKPSKSELDALREISYLLLIIPLIFPHQQKYAFLLALPALYYISYFLLISYKKGAGGINTKKYYTILTLFILSFILMTLTTDGIIGRNLNLITQHYKAITYGAIILIFNLLLCSPAQLQETGSRSRLKNS